MSKESLPKWDMGRCAVRIVFLYVIFKIPERMIGEFVSFTWIFVMVGKPTASKLLIIFNHFNLVRVYYYLCSDARRNPKLDRYSICRSRCHEVPVRRVKLH